MEGDLFGNHHPHAGGTGKTNWLAVCGHGNFSEKPIAFLLIYGRIGDLSIIRFVHPYKCIGRTRSSLR